MRTLTTALFLLAACTSVERERSANDGIVRFSDGARVHGDVRAREIHVPVGAVVTVERDVVLHATEWFLIQGELRGRDGDASRPDAPTLVLTSDDRLTITGVVRGGRGGDRTQEDQDLLLRGGAGGDVWASAPDFHMSGVLLGGHGGRGGPGAGGGAGGGLWLAGDDLTDHGVESRPSDGSPGFVGGDGGAPGIAIDQDQLAAAEARGLVRSSGGGDGGGVAWMAMAEWAELRRRQLGR